MWAFAQRRCAERERTVGTVVEPTCRAAGQVPQQPRVDCAEATRAVRARCGNAVVVVDQPSDLERAEQRAERQPAHALEPVLAVGPRVPVHRCRRPVV